MRHLPAAIALTALMLMGATCSPPADQPPAEAPSSSLAAEPAADASAEACAARGGELRRAGRLGAMRCVISFSDAGQPCTDGAQCQGDCRLADDAKRALSGEATGVCQANDDPFGCYTTVDAGQAGPTICVD